MEMRFTDLNPFFFAQIPLYHSNQGTVKLNDFPAMTTREMIMWLFLHRLVVTMSFTKPMLFNQSHLLQERKRAVDGGQAEVRSLPPGPVVDGLYLEMLITRLDDIQDQAALRRQAPASLSEDVSQSIVSHSIPWLTHLFPYPILTAYCKLFSIGKIILVSVPSGKWSDQPE